METFVSNPAPEELIRITLEYCKDFEYMEGAIVAGGFIRSFFAGEQIADMDIYFESEEAYTDALDLLDANEEWNKTYESDYAVTYRNGNKVVQLINMYYGNPEDIIKQFDYTVCSAALKIHVEDTRNQTTVTGTITMHPYFMHDLEARKLIYTGGSPLPLSSLKRAFKYVLRGYSIPDASLVELTRVINDRVDFEDEESFEYHTSTIRFTEITRPELPETTSSYGNPTETRARQARRIQDYSRYVRRETVTTT